MRSQRKQVHVAVNVFGPLKGLAVTRLAGKPTRAVPSGAAAAATERNSRPDENEQRGFYVLGRWNVQSDGRKPPARDDQRQTTLVER
jgi:hypothetical protein